MYVYPFFVCIILYAMIQTKLEEGLQHNAFICYTIKVNTYLKMKYGKRLL